MVPKPSISATKPATIKDPTPTLLLTNHQLRRENAALHAHLQEQLVAFKASQDELVEEKRKLWEEVQATRTRWEETCERVRALEAAREKKEKEKWKEIRDMGCGSRESSATAASSTSTKTSLTTAGKVVSASESAITNIAIAPTPAPQEHEVTSQPEPEPPASAPAAVAVAAISTTPTPANEATTPPPPIYTEQPTSTRPISIPRSRSGRIKQGSLTLSDYVSMCAQLVRDLRATGGGDGGGKSEAGEGRGEVPPGSAEREMMVEFVRGMRVKAEKLRLVEELERGGWVAFERETRAVEFFCGWGVVEGVVRGWSV